MDLILLFLGLVLCVVGILGTFLPALPGVSLSWLGILMIYLTSAVEINYPMLIITFVIAVIILILDYVIPAAGTKRFGGSKAAAIGTTIGLIVGIFAPIPFGFLIGPFLGAFIGEIIFNKQSNTKKALRAASGSFLGFLASTFMSFVTACVYLGIFISIFIKNSQSFF